MTYCIFKTYEQNFLIIQSPPFPCCPMNRKCLKENPDRKKTSFFGDEFLSFLSRHGGILNEGNWIENF